MEGNLAQIAGQKTPFSRPGYASTILTLSSFWFHFSETLNYRTVTKPTHNNSTLPNWFLRWLENPTQERQGKTQTQPPSTEGICKGWQFKTDDLQKLQTALLEDNPSLIRYKVNVHFQNSAFQSNFHWVLDTKGQWIHESLVCHQGWLAISLGMFQEGVYICNMNVTLADTFPSIAHDETANQLMEMCLHDISMKVWESVLPKYEKPIKDMRVKLYQEHINYAPVTLCYTGNDRFIFDRFYLVLFFLVFGLFPHFIIDFIFIPSYLQNGQQKRLNQSTKQLPIGLKYILIFSKPALHALRIAIIFIPFLIFPNVPSLFTQTDLVLHNMSLLISCCTLIGNFVYKLCSNQKSCQPKFHSLQPENQSNYIITALNKLFTFIKSNQVTSVVLGILNKLIKFPLLHFSQDFKDRVEQGKSYNECQTSLERADFFVRYNRESLKLITNYQTWLKCSWKVPLLPLVMFTQVALCLLGINWIWLFDIILFPLGYDTDTLLFSVLILNVASLVIFSFLYHVHSASSILEISLGVLVILLCLIVFKSGSKNKHIRALPVSICAAQVILSIWFVLYDYFNLCFTLMIGLLINPDVAGPPCFLLIAILGIIVKAAKDYYGEYAKLFKLTVEAAEDVYRDLKSLEHNKTNNLPKLTALHGTKYNHLLQKAASDLGPGTNSSRLRARSNTMMIYTDNNEPTIELSLFWIMVNEYNPRFYQFLMSIIFKYVIPFAFLLSFIWKVHLVISSIKSFLIIALTFGSVVLLAKNRESKQLEDDALKRKYEIDILAYVLYGRLYSDKLHGPSLQEDNKADNVTKENNTSIQIEI